jgi:Zn-dependent peptidase ImmA (M78 family)
MSSYAHEALRASLRARIDQLYRETDVEPSTGGKGRHTTPLGELIESFNLVSKELAGLSPKTALQYLSLQGTLIEPGEETSQEALAGFLYTSTSYGCIFVEANDHFVRRRFSAAHELGHYLLHFRPLLLEAEQGHKQIELTEAFYPGKTDDLEATASGHVGGATQYALQHRLPSVARMEYEANQFAAELLMPEETVRGMFARTMLRLNNDDLITARLAGEMLVSLEAMRWRLHHFGLQPLPRQQGGGRDDDRL